MPLALVTKTTHSALHRQENTDDPDRLHNILSALRDLTKDLPLVLPLHPRTKAKIEQQHIPAALKSITVLEPLSYLEMQRLQMSAKLFSPTPAAYKRSLFPPSALYHSLRYETEWVETVEANWNQLVGSQLRAHLSACRSANKPSGQAVNFYGNGNAAENIIHILGKSQ